jgi:signal transduction histidine kinase
MESIRKLIEISATYREFSDKFIELNSELVFRSEKAEQRVRDLIEANIKLADDLEKSAVELIESYQITKELNLFISILAHDLKNPFNVLLNLSDLLLENIHHKPMNEIEDYTKILNQSAQSANNLLNDILK